MEKVMGGGKEAGVIGGRGNYHFPVAEGIFHRFGNVVPGKVRKGDFGAALCFKDFGEAFSRGHSPAVN